MARYQYRQKNEEKLKNHSLSSGNNTSTLKLNTKLRSKTQTVLKTKNTATKDKTRTASKLKRKLLVYKKDGKFYIDHSAAYALKLTNVRAIMLNNPKLFEISLQFLNKIQNDKDIEIEYKEVNKEKEVDSNEGNLKETLEDLDQGEYGIGVHGIDQGSIEEKQSKALNISDEGLNIGSNSKTILSTAISLGINEESQELSQDITNYKFGNGANTKVIIAAPLCIQNENGEKIFLGFPEENKRTAGQQYEEHCILDRICGKLNKVPPEFILGYYRENPDGSESFIKNLKHYSNLSQESKEDLYRELSLSMDDISKDINKLIADGNIEQLSRMQQRMQERNMSTYMIDNAMMLAQKDKEQEKTQSSRVNGKRKILLDSYREVKSSDLTSAKETLREGIEEKERNNEGKEI